MPVFRGEAPRCRSPLRFCRDGSPFAAGAMSTGHCPPENDRRFSPCSFWSTAANIQMQPCCTLRRRKKIELKKKKRERREREEETPRPPGLAAARRHAGAQRVPGRAWGRLRVRRELSALARVQRREPGSCSPPLSACRGCVRGSPAAHLPRLLRGGEEAAEEVRRVRRGRQALRDEPVQHAAQQPGRRRVPPGPVPAAAE